MIYKGNKLRFSEIDVSDLELGYDFDQVNGTAVLIENEIGFEDDGKWQVFIA